MGWWEFVFQAFKETHWFRVPSLTYLARIAAQQRGRKDSQLLEIIYDRLQWAIDLPEAGYRTLLISFFSISPFGPTNHVLFLCNNRIITRLIAIRNEINTFWSELLLFVVEHTTTTCKDNVSCRKTVSENWRWRLFKIDYNMDWN